jgi:hypothetical protein
MKLADIDRVDNYMMKLIIETDLTTRYLFGSK